MLAPRLSFVRKTREVKLGQIYIFSAFFSSFAVFCCFFYFIAFCYFVRLIHRGKTLKEKIKEQTRHTFFHGLLLSAGTQTHVHVSANLSKSVQQDSTSIHRTAGSVF